MPASHGGSDDGPAAKFDGRGGAEGARKSNTCGSGATEASSRAHRAVGEGVARGCELQAPIPSRPAAGASTSSRADGAAKGVGLPSMPRLQRGVAWRDAESEDLGVAGGAEMSPSGGRVAARPRQLRVAQVILKKKRCLSQVVFWVPKKTCVENINWGCKNLWWL